MRLVGQRSLLSAAPIGLLAFQSLLGTSSASFPIVTASNTPKQAHVRHLSDVSLRKMSNNEGYVDDISPRAKKLIQDSIDLFSARPNHEIFKRSWTPDAVFEDPLCYAIGERQYKAQWWGLAAAFSKCELLAWHVTRDDPEEIHYVQRQRYRFRGLGIEKDILSTIRMILNEDGKVVHMQDRWDHKDPPANYIAWYLRRLNAVTLPYFINIPHTDGSKPNRAEL